MRPRRGAELEERRRLLYVALTRARDRLYVAGWLTRGAKEGQAEEAGEPCWHELVRRALLSLPGTQPFELEAVARAARPGAALCARGGHAAGRR